MAYMDQQRKAERAGVIKQICNEFGVKGTLSVVNHSTLVLNVKQGSIDFIGNYNKVAGKKYGSDPLSFREAQDYLTVNHYWFKEHFSGKARDFLSKVITAMYGGDYFDDSNTQADYFDCSHYIKINIGQYNSPYVLTK